VLKKYLSIFFLLLFLFPIVEKEAHAFEHIADVHCTANQKHFHSLEHHCILCDFINTDSNKPTDINYQFILAAEAFLFQPHIECVNIPDAFYNLPARAPPVV
jgi:hypothetical protein